MPLNYFEKFEEDGKNKGSHLAALVIKHSPISHSNAATVPPLRIPLINLKHFFSSYLDWKKKKKKQRKKIKKRWHNTSEGLNV